jgi:hypothetical protein
MCGPINGGGNSMMPPTDGMKVGTPPPGAKGAELGGGGAVPAGVSVTDLTSGGGATAQAATGAAVLGGGIGNIATVLQSLVAALQSVVAALGGAPVGGGGPTGKLAGGGPAGMPGVIPAAAGEQTLRGIEADIAQVPATDPRQAGLGALRPLIAKIRSESQVTGSVNPIDLGQLSLETKIAFATDPGIRDRFTAIRPLMDRLRADQQNTGSFDPLQLTVVNFQMAKVFIPANSPNAAQLASIEQRLNQAQASANATGQYSLDLNQISNEIAALMPPK